MKILLLVLGIALFIIGLQDAIRILANSTQSGILGWMPGGVSIHLALDVVLTAGGAFLAKYAMQMKSKV